MSGYTIVDLKEIEDSAGERRDWLAVNVWAGVGAPRRPAGVAGMDDFTIRVDLQQRLRDVLASLEDDEERDAGWFVLDPAGNALVLTV